LKTSVKSSVLNTRFQLLCSFFFVFFAQVQSVIVAIAAFLREWLATLRCFCESLESLGLSCQALPLVFLFYGAVLFLGWCCL